jgi:hypothetical protein
MLSVTNKLYLLSVIRLNVIILSVVMLNVVAPEMDLVSLNFVIQCQTFTLVSFQLGNIL